MERDRARFAELTYTIYTVTLSLEKEQPRLWKEKVNHKAEIYKGSDWKIH